MMKLISLIRGKKSNRITKSLTSSSLLAATCIFGVDPEKLEQFLSKKVIYNAIQDNEFLKHLEPKIVRQIMDSMYQKKFSEGSQILGNCGCSLIIVAEGEFEVAKKSENPKIKGEIGIIYGDDEILMGDKRIISITAITDCKVWILKRKVFKAITKSTGKNIRDLEFLRNFSWFKNVNVDVLYKIADIVEVQYFDTHDTLEVKENTLYIISNGSVKFLRKNADTIEERILRVFSRGDHFNGNSKSAFDIISFAPGVELLSINIDALIPLIGEIGYFKQEVITWSIKKTNRQTSCADIKFEDLETISCIGRGNFGRVNLVRNTKDKNMTQLFALKLISKDRTVTILQESHVIAEREILLQLEHPFIVKLYKTFRDDRYVYFLFEACQGGQLWELLNKKGFFDNETARFVAASALEALSYLHSKQIIYRDLKSDNMVIDLDGYVKLVDFGFSKHLGYTDRTWSFCGTPCNIAPEVILNIGHDRAVDLWALGMLVYELLCGCTIFSDWNPRQAYEQTMRGVENAEFSYHVSGKPAEDLIKHLCKHEPEERLGYKTMEDVKNHRWFRNFDWDGLISKRTKPPNCLIPKLTYPTEVASSGNLDVNLAYEPYREESNWDKAFE